MSEDAAKPSGPDLAAGIALDDIADGAMLQAMSTARPCCWRGAARSCSPSAPSARIITARSPRA